MVMMTLSISTNYSIIQSGTYSPSPYRHQKHTVGGMTKGGDILKRFGDKVRRMRAQKGINSQMDLSFKTGLDRTYIGGVERVERNVSLRNIEKIAKALGVSVEELFRP